MPCMTRRRAWESRGGTQVADRMCRGTRAMRRPMHQPDQIQQPGVPFRDRREAGRAFAAALASYAHRSDVLVLALPRGGVPVAYEVAQALGAPLDIFLVRKLGLPGQE